MVQKSTQSVQKDVQLNFKITLITNRYIFRLLWLVINGKMDDIKCPIL